MGLRSDKEETKEKREKIQEALRKLESAIASARRFRHAV
jgi:hypothetical protein